MEKPFYKLYSNENLSTLPDKLKRLYISQLVDQRISRIWKDNFILWRLYVCRAYFGVFSYLLAWVDLSTIDVFIYPHETEYVQRTFCWCVLLPYGLGRSINHWYHDGTCPTCSSPTANLTTSQLHWIKSRKDFKDE